jgi:hypothetical protein
MPHAQPNRIELNLLNVKQLFNSMDPSPFHERDLDDDAEEFIVSWAREHPIQQPMHLVVHLREPCDRHEAAQLITNSIHHFFEYKADLNRREFRRLMRQGWISLLIGLTFLIGCVAAAQFLAPRFGHLEPVVHEGLIIIGWVAMWHPLEIYLYLWWPVREMGKVYRKLSTIPIEVNVGVPASA